MVMIGVALAIGIILIAMMSYFFQEKLNDDNIIAAKEVVTGIENELFLAARVSPGYVRNFEIPSKLNEEDYNLSIQGDDIVLNYKNIDFLGSSPNLTGQLIKGENTIRNVNGRVCLNLETC